ncbi:MAG: precorrin-3B C(17)-methyltransferase [Alphaproteobacteria bacterium]
MSKDRDIAIVALTRGGARLARKLQADMPQSRVHGLAGRVDDCDTPFTEATAHLAALFATGQAIVGICAAGILIRALATGLDDKRNEPPVIAVSPDGQHVVPLLGGHHGANRLATRVADITGGSAAVTTAGEALHGIALDDPPPGWALANPESAKPVMAALLAGDHPTMVIEAGDPAWLADLPIGRDGAWMIRISDRAITPAADEFLIHPPTLALGVGCERDCDPDELIALVDDTLAGAGLSPASVAAVTSIDVKMDEAAVHAVAAHLEAPIRYFEAARLEAETPRLENPSEIVFREVGAHGVAEAAALAAVGSEGKLVVAKRKSVRATCAVARGTHIDPANVGTARGTLSIVGTGPGDAAHRIPATDTAVAAATDLVGYGPYLDLLGVAAHGRQRHDFGLGAEEERCRHALELAAAGRNVALVSSGDPGIFAMASLVFELLDRDANPAWQRIAISVHPGVSAMQLAAARAGAPLGHDFCAISLSDLLTPWPAIEARLRAAAQADFVVALYNPASRRRRQQFETARDILLAHRPDDTPVVVARNLARPGEQVSIVPLAELSLDAIDMLTIVIIGNSQSQSIAGGASRWTYTPRGYAAKAQDKMRTKTRS